MTDHPSSSAPSARGRSRRKEARPAELLEAATRLFVEKGYAATKVEEVAALAQVSKGTLFLYYPSKQALLKAVVRENIAGRFAEWQAELEAFAGTTPELVRYAFQVWQRGVARGELRPLDLDAAIHLITTPMFAYIHWRHSIGMLYPQSLGVSAPLYFQTHVDNLLRGLSATAPDV